MNQTQQHFWMIGATFQAPHIIFKLSWFEMLHVFHLKKETSSFLKSRSLTPHMGLFSVPFWKYHSSTSPNIA
jgi:hypothetical protein